jgi:D-glycero-D-manno-heptose 1,7-bisphosphate phosphatase
MPPLRQAVILAGGKGLRLLSLTQDRPKPMIVIHGRPFLEYLFDILKSNGIEEVVFLLGYLHEKITEYVGDGSRFGIRVRYSVGDVEDGTGTRIRNAKALLDSRFLLLYCDNYLRHDLGKLYDFHLEHRVPATVTVYSNKYGITKNNIAVDAEGYVRKYDRSRLDPNLNGVELGFFVLEKDIVHRMPEGNFYFEEEMLPKLIAEKQLAGFMVDTLYYSISTPERVKLTERFLDPTRKYVFLDRDGVINTRMPPGDYVKSWSEFSFLPGAKEAMKLLTEYGYEIYVISNQAGIGRGMMKEGTLWEIHNNMERELAQAGAKITAMYYCPHKTEDNCECRKPKPGMLFKAAIEHQIDLPRATFIGDDERDIEAGRAAGAKTMLLTEKFSLLDAAKSLLTQ